MATRMFERPDPRVQRHLRTIEQLSTASKPRPAAQPQTQPTPPTPSSIPAGDGKNPEIASRRNAPPPEHSTAMFSPTMVGGSQSMGTPANAPPPPQSHRSPKNNGLSNTSFPPPPT